MPSERAAAVDPAAAFLVAKRFIVGRYHVQTAVEQQRNVVGPDGGCVWSLASVQLLGARTNPVLAQVSGREIDGTIHYPFVRCHGAVGHHLFQE